MKFKLFKTILIHKWFIIVAGRKLGVGWWRLIRHDWTKLLPCEFTAYAQRFHGPGDDAEGFRRAWLHHQNMNDHHPEYWMMRSTDQVEVKLVDVPGPALCEMVADWIAASRAYEGEWPKRDTWKWFQERLPLVVMTDRSLIRAMDLLNGYWENN